MTTKPLVADRDKLLTQCKLRQLGLVNKKYEGNQAIIDICMQCRLQKCVEDLIRG